MNKSGILIIISGPSGSGKGTIVQELVKTGNFCLSISATTREPRSYEEEGKHYFFVSDEKFEGMKENGELLEWARFCEHSYGTPKKYVENKLKSGYNVILEIEVQGALKVKDIYPECVLIFTLPPDINELRSRLIHRNTETDDIINKRIKRALEELEIMPKYDYVVVNDTIEQAKIDIETIVSAETMNCKRNTDIIEFFKGEIK